MYIGSQCGSCGSSLSSKNVGYVKANWKVNNLDVYILHGLKPLFIVFLFRPEMVVGWYHSHPGFGCWLSGVDINTQQVIACTHAQCIRLKINI